jgi:hypothetical protein
MPIGGDCAEATSKRRSETGVPAGKKLIKGREGGSKGRREGSRVPFT